MPSHWQYISYFLYILTYLLHMRSRRGSSGGQVRNILAAKPPRVVERSHEALDKRIRRFVEFRGGRSHHEIFRDHVRVHHLTEGQIRSEEHTSELQSLMRISYAVFCLNKQTYQRSQ